MNCKKGDLARIKSSAHPENVGRIVEVICLSAPGEEKVFSDGKTYRLSDSIEEGPVWFIFCPTPLKRTLNSGTTRLSCEGWVHDHRLCPITPPNVALTKQDEECIVEDACDPLKALG